MSALTSNNDIYHYYIRIYSRISMLKLFITF